MKINDFGCKWQEQIRLFFALCNKYIFRGELLQVPFFIDPKKKEIFCFVPNEGIYCGKGLLISKNIEDMIVSFFHELIHMHNLQVGISDLSSNNYHNKYFLKKANAVGFFVYATKNKGFADLSLRQLTHKGYSPKISQNNLLLTFINNPENSKLVNSLISILKKNLLEKIASKKSKEFFLKYECKCPKPFNSIRSGRRPDSKNALQIHCKNCNSDFFCVSELK